MIIIKHTILITTRKKQHKYAPLGNVPDEIVHIFSLVNNTDFVNEVVYTEGNNKPLLVICYTKNMMKDMTQFLKSDNDRILGVDRTFNLGAGYVINFVYKNTKVLRKETDCTTIVNGYLPYPNECSSYIRCVDGISYKQYCPGELQWNIHRLYCDYAENAGCSTK
ncbi:unnamed protein product [Mytilus coruscus]|uniref:Chitin-binding type-2 domain-containing protein n=1 Tax=Mytilus coruscus TaxID=42192 RepID=A0A6J8F146_MYTCO|nr:unnamed protein product [Mytilus coruscus]